MAENNPTDVTQTEENVTLVTDLRKLPEGSN